MSNTYIGPDGLMHNHALPFPTLKEVESAHRLQLGRWMRFLPSPGMDWINNEDFKEMMKYEVAVLLRVIERFDDFGGWDLKLSKEIGWSL
jgi:hypothetical protein